MLKNYIRLRCWVCNNTTNEVWNTHWLTAVADIRSDRQISQEEAENLLLDSDIDRPVKVGEVDFWMELSLDDRWEQLNLLQPENKISKEEFIRRWSEKE